LLLCGVIDISTVSAASLRSLGCLLSCCYLTIFNVTTLFCIVAIFNVSASERSLIPVKVFLSVPDIFIVPALAAEMAGEAGGLIVDKKLLIALVTA
jgi:hypothetical protein